MRWLGSLAMGLTWLVLGLAAWSAMLQEPIFFAVVRSGSMEPSLRAGDLALAVPSSVLAPRVGDIAIFQGRPGFWVVHRIVGGDPYDGFITRGDANPRSDQDGLGFPPVALEAIVATVPSVDGAPMRVPGVGHLSIFLQDGVRDGNPAAVGLLAAAVVAALWPSGGGAGERRRKSAPLFSAAYAAAAGLATAGLLVAMATSQALPLP